MHERRTTMFTDEAARAANKRIRNVRKKLHEIEKLENRTACGDMLEANQLAKLATKSALAAELACLEASWGTTPVEPERRPYFARESKSAFTKDKGWRRNQGSALRPLNNVFPPSKNQFGALME